MFQSENNTFLRGPIVFDDINQECFSVEKDKKFYIGRNPDANIDIASKFISRKQCVIKLTNEKVWAIRDLSSFKSTRVNDKEIKTEGQILNCGDEITIVDLPNLKYTFFKDTSKIPWKRRTKKRKLDVCSNNELSEEDVQTSYSQEVGFLESKNECAYRAENEKLTKELKDLKDKFHQVSDLLAQTQKESEDAVNDKNNIALKLLEEQTTKETLIEEMQNYIDLLKECEMEKDRLAVERIDLKVQLENERTTKNNLKECGQADSLCEDHPVHQFDINSLFDAVEFNSMKEELELVRKELLAKDGRINELLAEKDILSTNITDLLEQEFTCSVCSEVIFEATTLDCRHTFCAKCVATWKLRKKECPVCRAKLKVEVKSLVIDSFIDKLSEHIGGEFKKRREEVKAERASNRPPGAEVSPYRSVQAPRRGGGNQASPYGPQTARRGGGGRRRARAVSTVALPPYMRRNSSGSRRNRLDHIDVIDLS